MLPDHLFIKEIDLDLEAAIHKQLGLDNFHKLALESLLDQGIPPIKSALADWEIKEDLLFFKGKVYVPNNEELRCNLIKQIHESKSTEHPGQWSTVEQVQQDYWWLGMTKFIRNFIDGCVPCQQMKANTHPTRTPIQPLQVPKNSFPFQVCTMDLITDLPEVDSSDAILIVVDHLSTKGAIFTPRQQMQ
uniref:Integrase zinc-binding domain-containing protein n=1 Tax=Moniliophthora roreri TaxID=221103 RepID=A0A0W0G212_MONRR